MRKIYNFVFKPFKREVLPGRYDKYIVWKNIKQTIKTVTKKIIISGYTKTNCEDCDARRLLEKP